ncbi:probable cytochrome P450 CYP44 isoform X3 [Cryptotermes secundus]|uniref:probable cytochrome P450 CYP44 isoform X3 n=1 Tax=Cryptotermes secundus TaxID=105785 RepID=UPI000CD7B797|nr:probable cytochrome P450 CYP44 isoform X3 [Cryptotermes secundus]
MYIFHQFKFVIYRKKEMFVTYPRCFSNCIVFKVARSLSSLSKDINIAGSDKIKAFEEIPGPVRLPIIGNLYQYMLGKYKIERYHKVLEDLYKQYGPLETAQLYRQTRGMSLGLGNVNGDEWYRLRSAVRQMMLRRREVHYYLPLVQEVATDFVKHIIRKRGENGEIENLSDEVAKWSQESAGIVCFEMRLGCLSGNLEEERAQAMVNANKVMFNLSGQLKFSLPLYKYIFTPKWKKLVEAEDFFYKTATQYVNTTINKIDDLIQRSELPEGKYNFMTYLLSRKELSRKDVTVITFSLFADGLSTTVPALLYNLYCLATNPEIQEEAYREIHRYLERDEPITYTTINKLSYLKAVMKETFRLYPIGTEISRIIPKDLVLSGYHVPANTHVNLNPHVHFKSEKYFPRASEFLPERWMRGGESSDIHPYLLTPFGHGVRTCAGMRFAEQDLHVALCCILLNFQLKYPVTDPLEQIYSTLLFPDGPVRVQFISRN